MKFYDVSTEDSLVHEAWRLCDADIIKYPLKNITARINQGLDRAWGIITGADGRWQFDDTNYTNFPTGTQDLVAGQSDYSFDSSVLEIEIVSILGVDGKYRKLLPIDKGDMALDPSVYQVTSSMPLWYDKQGNSIVLYPPPSATATTLTAGLKVYFKRNFQKFTTADTTAEPGFANPYHVLLSYYAALPFCLTYKPERVGMLQGEIARWEMELRKHYSRRAKDERHNFTSEMIMHR